MSDQRRLTWKSGRLLSTPITDFLSISETVQDPSIPNLPLTTPASGGVYTITALAGSYTYAGQSATITRSRLLTAQAGSYTYAGQSATITRSRLLTAQAGAYTYSGQSATILKTRLITAQAGAYSYTGQSATITRSRLLTAQAGAYAYTGQSATITYTPAATVYTITALPGAYTYSGQDANITIVASQQQDTHDGKGRINWQVKRRKLTLEEKPEQHLNWMIQDGINEYFAKKNPKATVSDSADLAPIIAKIEKAPIQLIEFKPVEIEFDYNAAIEKVLAAQAALDDLRKAKIQAVNDYNNELLLLSVANGYV